MLTNIRSLLTLKEFFNYVIDFKLIIMLTNIHCPLLAFLCRECSFSSATNISTTKFFFFIDIRPDKIIKIYINVIEVV